MKFAHFMPQFWELVAWHEGNMDVLYGIFGL